MTNSNEKPSDGAGVGLVLSRFRGERIMITADKSASDEEILSALRNDGIVITLVDMCDFRHPSYKGTRRLAKVGIRASNSLSIAREEIINRKKPRGKSDGNKQAQGTAEEA